MSREIVLIGQISGTRNGKDWPGPGSRLELDDKEADGLVAGGLAYEVDDDRVKHFGNGNAGEAFADEMIAGAPTGRDWTEGQQDTNLARARMLALDERDTREVTREAAERAGLTDALTVPGANPDNPVVGDDNPNPTDMPSMVKDGGKPDDGAKLVDDKRKSDTKTETASVEPASETAADTRRPGSRTTK